MSKNTARYIKASQAEKIRKYFEEVYICESVKAWDIDEDRRDDPGDWDRDTDAIDECNQLADEAEKFAELFGGIDREYCQKEITRRFYGE